MQIGELATVTGVSTRALRHYEETGVLIPERISSGYRSYTEADIIRVVQIKAMISAGLGTATIKRYFDCARIGRPRHLAGNVPKPARRTGLNRRAPQRQADRDPGNTAATQRVDLDRRELTEFDVRAGRSQRCPYGWPHLRRE